MQESSDTPPCETEWRKHLRSAERTKRCRRHTCPLGLQCSCVPIVLEQELVGLAKCVVGGEVPRARLDAAVGTLEVVIASFCHEYEGHLMRQELGALRESVDVLRQVKQPTLAAADDPAWTGQVSTQNNESVRAGGLIQQAQEYLKQRFPDSSLCLSDVATALGRNEKYLSHLFARQCGVRMRSYINGLRVRRACELLLQTPRTIEQISQDAGFLHTSHFRQAFRRSTGLTATKYRQIFYRSSDKATSARGVRTAQAC